MTGRILVIGDPEWRDPTSIRQGITRTASTVGTGHPGIVVPDTRGAATLAAITSTARGWTVETHHAHWAAPCTIRCPGGHRRLWTDTGIGRPGTYCPNAGKHRDDRIAAMRLDGVVAFLIRRPGYAQADPVRAFADRLTGDGHHVDRVWWPDPHHPLWDPRTPALPRQETART